MERRFFAGRFCAGPGVIALSLACLAVSITVATAKEPGHTARRRVLVVTANLHETDFYDVTSTRDLKVFVRRMFNRVPRSPDVVVVQELWGTSSDQLAKIMSRKSRDHYRVAVGAGNPPWRQPDAAHVVGTDSAIIFNKRTMSVGKSGYIRLGYKTSNAAPNREVRVKRHPFALVRERRSNFAIPVASVHFPKAEHFASRKISQRIKGHWVRRINRQLGRTFRWSSARTSRVIAGDLNNPRCKRNMPVCTFTPAYRIATRRLGYRDSVTVLNGWGNPIDFILSKAPVVDSGVDTPKRPKQRYSDHVFRWALLEKKDRTPPSAPGRISEAKGSRHEVRLRGWKKARDGGTGFSHFDVRRSRKGPDGGFVDVGNTGKTMFRDRKVKRGVKYWYRVVAYDRRGNRSRASRVVSVRAGEPPRDHRSGSKGHGKGPNLDAPLVRDIERPRITRPDVDVPASDRPDIDPPAPPLIAGPQLDPPKPPSIDPPPRG